MKKILLIIVCISYWGISCNNTSEKTIEIPKTAAELKAELKQQEELSPLDYLDDQGITLQPQRKKIRNAGLFRDAEYEDDGAIIEGYIANTATLATFKDLVVKVSFYSQTETLIKEDSYVIYEYYKPNSKTKLSIKIETPNTYKTFGFQITGAKTK